MKVKKQFSSILAIVLCLSMVLRPMLVLAGEEVNSMVKVIPTTEQLAANDYVVYFANCGSAIVDQVAEGDYMGLYQSVTDKFYGEDTTGYSWGLRPNTVNSNSVSGGAITGTPSVNKVDTYLYTGPITYVSGTSGFYYDFELPEGYYEVTVGFKNPWSSRPIDVILEGTTYDSQLVLGQNTLVESKHKLKVEDGQLNVFVHNPTRMDVYKDPLINYIIVRVVPGSISGLQAKIDSIEARLNDATATGVQYATSPLPDKYLDAVGKPDTLADMQAKLTEAKNMVTDGIATTIEIQDECEQLEEQFASLRTIDTFTSFSGTEGAVWKDTNGIPIQAHGGQVQKMNGKWWWYGEDKTKGYRSNGISAYSSDDLYNWTFEGYVMRTVTSRDQLDTDPYYVALYGGLTAEEKDNVYLCINNTTAVIERPKVIYNEKTKKYVLWFHADGPTVESPTANYAAASAGVAVSDSPTGPFTFINRYRLNVCPSDQLKGEWYEASKGFARDMNLFIDDDAKHTAYIIYSSEENRTMFISKLNEDYTYLATPVDQAVHGTDFVRLFPGAQREAPAVFKYNGKYYMVNSGATGWDPNAAQYWVADSMLGTWKSAGNPCVGDTKNTTFDSQSTNIIPYDIEKGLYIYMGDRWFSSNLGDSRYIWLPVELTVNGDMQLKKHTNWTLEDLNALAPIKMTTQLQSIYNSLSDLPTTVEVMVYENGALTKKVTPVAWDSQNVLPTVKTKVTGMLTAYNAVITANVLVIPNTLKYYIDCGATAGSDNYDMITKKVTLLNETYDKAYVSGSWGYTGTTSDIGTHSSSSREAFESGFWAKTDKKIEYIIPMKAGSYQLLAGFQEWWNTTRKIGISISYMQAGAKVTNTLGTITNSGTTTANYVFDLPVDADVTVSIYEPTAGPDVLLSWLAVNENVVPTDPSGDVEASKQKAKEAAEAITLGDITVVKADLILPVKGINDATISWKSSNGIAIGTDGKVTRPTHGTGNATVVLIATVDVNGQTVERIFNVTVLEKEAATNPTDQSTTSQSEQKQDYIIETVIRKQTATIEVSMTPQKVYEIVRNATKYKPYNFTMDLPMEAMIDQLIRSKISKVQVVFQIPRAILNNENVKIKSLVLDKMVLTAVRNTMKGLTIVIADEDGTVQYQWDMSRKAFKNTKRVMADIDVSMQLVPAEKLTELQKILNKDSQNNQGLVAVFAQESTLPVAATVRIHVGNREGIKAGGTVYVYQYDEVTKKLNALIAPSSCQVNKEGYLELPIVRGSKYIILSKEVNASVTVPLLDQVK